MSWLWKLKQWTPESKVQIKFILYFLRILTDLNTISIDFSENEGIKDTLF
jgi:hypothetical protein